MDQVKPSYQWYRHCEVLGDVLQRVADDDLRRVMIFMPPRHGKSEETSRLFSAYYLYRHPERWVGINSYAAALADTLSRASRENYLAAGGAIKSEAKAVRHWETGSGGGLWSAGVGGPITGKGGHLLIVDDPLKNAEEAASEIIREKQKEWYASTFYTRLEPGGAIIDIQTRWNQDDLSGWLLSQEQDEVPEGWHIVNFPAFREEDEPFPVSCTREEDWREPGEPLCPERYDADRLERIRRRIGSYFFSALYQQRPRPREGGTFKRHWFPIVDASPVHAERVRYWDKAGTEGDGDYTVGVRMACSPEGVFYVEDVVRGRWSAGERDRIMRQTADLDAQAFSVGVVQQWIEQEPGSGGRDSALASIRVLAGHTVAAETASGDKETRADPFASQAEAGNVRLVRGDWNKAYLDELGEFPTGKHDDQVDASSGAFNQLANGGSVIAIEEYQGW